MNKMKNKREKEIDNQEGDTAPLKNPQKGQTPYKQNGFTKGQFKINKSYKGEPIESKVIRALYNKEPITDHAEQIYTERKDGVVPEHNIRTDRFERAAEAMSSATKSHITKREERGKKIDKPVDIPKPDAKD